jgi:ParB family transcriptional regulator, chromosome partitioning protein
MAEQTATEPRAIPQGVLEHLRPDQLKPNPQNPRHLFDPGPLHDLKENIRTHGVLVPITVYQVRGQDKYAILDGERRFICCKELVAEGHEVLIPANVVPEPTPVAGLLYMFNIHNFREAWELMPTALSLRLVMEKLGVEDDRRLEDLTGLSSKQIERCKILLEFPEQYRRLSLESDPAKRIPSNFWIEARPVIDLAMEHLPDLAESLGRNGITDKLVEKYRAKRVRSVIHFRRIVEAYEVAEEQRVAVLDRLREYIGDDAMETRAAFDGFVADTQRIQSALRACSRFIHDIRAAEVDHAVEERDELFEALGEVREFVVDLLAKLEYSEPPEDLDALDA